MNTAETILEPYAELESDVSRLMASLFSETCGLCTACCCRADICEEAIQSPFLSMLLERQGLSAADIDDRVGWLDLHGCMLEYGKPPVCHAYFCDELLARLPDDDARHAARMLGRLIHHVGRNALGGWHLVEIMNANDLEKVDIKGVMLRLEEARQAFVVIENYCHTGRIDTDGQSRLAVITTDDPE